MRKRSSFLKIVLVFSLLLLPFALSLLNCSQAIQINHIGIASQHFDTSNTVLIAGNLYHFNVSLSTDAKKLSIVAYHGDTLPDATDRNPGNYYRWEYHNGEWKDTSGHGCSYLIPSQCTKVNHTYSFYLSIDHKTHPGKWTIVIFVDDHEVSSQSTVVVVAGLHMFLSSIIGIFESRVDSPHRDFIAALLCYDQKQQASVTKKDTVLYMKETTKVPGASVRQKQLLDEIMTHSSQHIAPKAMDDSLQSIGSTYPRSKLKDNYVQTSSVTLKKGDGGRKSCGSLFGKHQHFFVFAVGLLVLSAACMPFITHWSVGNENAPAITILNIKSYPMVGGNWIVQFTTMGVADLVITAVNGTTWKDDSDDYDLRFSELKCGNETMKYSWIDDSVVIENYSSTEIGYEICEVLTSGKHILRFQFGDDVAYANNDATDWWWNESWINRKLLTINASQVDDDLTNFPILVSFTDTDLRDDAQNSGNDIVFTNVTGTKLNHEIESFNGSTGELVAWVNVTSLSSSTNTNIWMYYNNSGCSSQENEEGTWDDNYVAVWHFHDDSLNDSTTNGYDGSNGGTTYNSSCKIGGGRAYAGDDTIDINNFYDLSTELTAEAWAYRDSGDSSSFVRFFTEGPDWSDNDWCLYWRTSDDNVRFVINDNDYSEGGTFTYSATWFHVAVTYDAGDAYLYRNGSEDADWSGQYANSINNNENLLTIGNQNGGGRGWNGKIDEVRISNINRSASWLSTSFNTMNAPDTFLSRGDEENVTNTFVEDIDPYTITYKPYMLTASAPSGLDNVILWYRYSTDNMSWGNWVQNETDSVSPWQWNFNFSNGTGYYEFYSIGNKSGLPDEIPPGSADAICYFNQTINTDPSIDVVYPLNGSSSISLQPTCRLYANDSDGDTLTVRWYENTTGSFVLRNTNTSVTADSLLSYTFSQFDAYFTMYWWRISINDSNGGWANATYHFTTRTVNTVVDTIYPYAISVSPFSLTATGDDSLDNVTLWYRYSNDNDSWSSSGPSVNFGRDSYPGSGTTRTISSYVYAIEYEASTTGYVHNITWYLRKTAGTTNFKVAIYNSDKELLGDGSRSGVGSANWYTTELDSPVYVEEGQTYWLAGRAETATTYCYHGSTTNENGLYHILAYGSFPQNTLGSTGTHTNRAYYVYATIKEEDIDFSWVNWGNASNPDTSSPWEWSFDFPNGTGYYQFYSIGRKDDAVENAPDFPDAICYYDNPAAPVINNYDLRNSTGSKLNNATGLLDAATEYYFTVNVTDANGWTDIKYINITAWYDFGSESTTYNQTTGGNLNMFLQYRNILGVKEFLMIWPDDEAQLISSNCTITSYNSTTRIFKFSFVPFGQVRWANSNGSWDGTQNITNDPYSWNFNITVIDSIGLSRWKTDEYGIYRYTSVTTSQDWVDVFAAPGFNDSSSIVTVIYSSNYDFNLTIYFEENLTNTSWGDFISIADNVHILANADPTDDITYDILFLGIGEANAVDIINSSGIFTKDGVSQAVNVQFDVFIPLGTSGGRYTARVATKISHAT